MAIAGLAFRPRFGATSPKGDEPGVVVLRGECEWLVEGGEAEISVLIEAERSGAMNFDEFISTCMLILMAGHGSTIDVLGSGMHALLRFPEQMARLRNDPGLIQTGVQEMFRYESPLPFFHRHCVEDVEICGRRFERGTKFGLLYARRGSWGDRVLVPESWIDATTSVSGEGNEVELATFAYGWWRRVIDGTRVFYAEGAGGQLLAVIPDLEMVLVVTSDPQVPGGLARGDRLIEQYILRAAGKADVTPPR